MTPVTPELGDGDIQAVHQALKRLSGIAIPLSKKVMVMHRLRKRIAELNCASAGDYLDVVKQDRAEQQRFVNLLTTNETVFFRTARVWNYFRDEFLPSRRALSSTAPARIWSAAAATGEEPYSIAMSCLDYQTRHPAFQFQIVATDIDTDVLAEAERGVFPARKVEKLQLSHPHFARTYFTPQGPDFVASEELRRRVQFRRHNLMEQPRVGPPRDVVFLRNVLIYFEPAEQMQILQRVAGAMAPGAILILGESESISRLDCPFTYLQPLVYRKSG